jgi:DNA-binding NtrC family response regulator
MLDRIHASRVTEFRRVLRACAIAVSAGRHGLVLRVPRGQDPDGFARAFHLHCRERAGRPVRLLSVGTGGNPSIRHLAALLGLAGDAIPMDVTLPDLLGSRDRWFERLRAALAADLATDGVSTGPGLLIVEGDFRASPTLAAFLSFLCPGASPWRSLPSGRPRTEQFAVVAVVEAGDGLPDADGIPEGAESLAVRPLDADDLRAAADATHDLLFSGTVRRAARPARRCGAGQADAVADDETVEHLMADGALLEALALAATPGARLTTSTAARVRVAAGRNREALDLLAAAADTLDDAMLVDAGRLAVALGQPDLAAPFLRSLAGPGREPRSTFLRDLLGAELALSRGDTAAVEGALPAARAAPSDLACTLHNTIGAARFRTGDTPGARQAFQAVLAIADAPARETARARHNLGLVALREGRYPAAAALLQEAIVEADDLGESHGGALARRNLAITLEHSGRYAPALELAVEAADRLSRQERPADLAAAFLTVADLLLTFGEWDRATALVADARGRAGSSSVVAARCAFKLAECRLLRGDVLAARDLELAVGTLEQAGLRDLAVFATARTAEACLAAHDHPGAAAHARRVLDRDPPREDEAAGRAFRVLGRLDLDQDAPARAAQSLDAARRILTQCGQREPLALVLADLAEVSSRLGDGDTAVVLTEEARALAVEIAQSVPPAYRASFRARPGIVDLLSGGTATVDAALPTAPSGSMPIGLVSLAPRPRLRHLLPKIVGTSAALERVLMAIERVRDVPVPILLAGASGTGKELFAEALHTLSPRADRPFVRVNAAAFPDTLLLTELFGHEKGAFTGAHARRIGRFESAHGGTLFLDEIGDVSEAAQAALLRVIEEQRFTRVGGSETVSVNVRLVFATNRDLEERMRSGHLRRDFYHRIAGLTIPVPPLRERLEDIPALVGAFLADLTREGGRPVTVVAEAMDLLQGHNWPGNVRELRNVVRRSVLLSGGPVLTREALMREAPELARSARRVEGSLDVFDLVFGRGMPLFDARRQVEVALIREALSRCDGNISAAASLLGMKRPRLSQMVKEYDLKDPVPGKVREGR